jgi:hypothetical protein
MGKEPVMAYLKIKWQKLFGDRRLKIIYQGRGNEHGTLGI